MRNSIAQTMCVCAFAGVLTLVTGCQTDKKSSDQTTSTTTPPPMAQATPAPAADASAPAAATEAGTPVAVNGIYRIKIGSTTPFTDSAGNVWQAEVGVNGGQTIDRDAGTAIANTKDAGLFLSEHYSMDSIVLNIPNGKYTAKLYFAETYDGITAAGGRVFSYNVQGHDFKDFDVFAKSGGANTAYVETVPVEVTNGKFTITFTPNVENPEINAIELDPQK